MKFIPRLNACSELDTSVRESIKQDKNTIIISVLRILQFILNIKTHLCMILFKCILWHLEDKEKAVFEKQYYYQPPGASLLKREKSYVLFLPAITKTNWKIQLGIAFSASPLKWEATDNDIFIFH